MLVLNAGSASLKFQLIGTGQAAIAVSGEVRLARGQIERIGGEAVIGADTGRRKTTDAAPLRNHAEAVAHIIAWLGSQGLATVDAVGHRVVHGGERFTESTLVDERVLTELEDLIDLAPLHNPHNISGIKASRSVLGAGIPNVAVFDTAFHHTLPERAHIYAIPYQLYRRHRALHTGTWRTATVNSLGAVAMTRGSSLCTLGTVHRPARSQEGTRLIPQWDSRRSKAWSWAQGPGTWIPRL